MRANHPLDILHYQRGDTRIELRRTASGVFLLRVNKQEETPIAPRELGDLLHCWTNIARDHGIEIRPYD